MGLRWTEEEYEHYLQSRNTQQVPKPKPGPGIKAADETKVKGGAKGSSESGDMWGLIVTAYCRRHTDPDNLCPKWYIDELVRAGIILDDSSRHVAWIAKSVVKIGKAEEEKTVIEVVKL